MHRVESMRVWKSFGSAHSSNISIIGVFNEGPELDIAEKIIKDFEFADSRYKDVHAFCGAWEAACPSLKFMPPPCEDDFSTGINDSYNVKRENGKITVSHFSTPNIGGIIKLMLMYNPIEIKILKPPKT